MRISKIEAFFFIKKLPIDKGRALYSTTIPMITEDLPVTVELPGECGLQEFDILSHRLEVSVILFALGFLNLQRFSWSYGIVQDSLNAIGKLNIWVEGESSPIVVENQIRQTFFVTSNKKLFDDLAKERNYGCINIPTLLGDFLTLRPDSENSIDVYPLFKKIIGRDIELEVSDEYFIFTSLSGETLFNSNEYWIWEILDAISYMKKDDIALISCRINLNNLGNELCGRFKLELLRLAEEKQINLILIS